MRIAGNPVLALVLLAAACSVADTPLTIRGAWETFIQTNCNKGHACRDSFQGTQAEFEEELGASAAACVNRIQDPEFDQEVSAYEGAANNNRLVYDAGNAKTCFDAMRAQSCADFWLGTDPAPACDEIFIGQVATGGACTLGDECVGGACVVTATTMTCI